MLEIEVIGSGLDDCHQLADRVRQAGGELDLAFELTMTTDVVEIARTAVERPPALVVDGTIRSEGRVPSVAEIKTMLLA